MNSEPIAVLLIGRAGSGKGTQAGFLTKHLGAENVLYIYAGEKLRKLSEDESLATARLLKERILLKGAKAPDFFAIWSWADSFISNFKSHMHLVLDGSPRTVLEAMVLDEAFAFYERRRVYPVHIDITREEAFQRLKARGRHDDEYEAISNRLDWFEKTVIPVIDYYEKESPNKVIRINGIGSREEVFKRIADVLH